ncbi:FAD-dependent oxidoreductase [Microbispora siamensis]
MRAIVCGAGIAGTALAWHLERAGWDVRLVERAPAFRTGGYMIDFYGPGLEAAGRMGLRPRLEEVRHPVHEIGYVDGSGRQTSRLAVKAGFAEVVSLLRGDLARVLAEQVRAPVRYGTTVAAFRQDGGGVEVELTDGTRHEADLLVGADGVHSRIRELVFGPEGRVLLGDACQAVSLFAGHGASLAVAAAWVLADELRAASSGELSPALDRYAARMRPVVADVQSFGRRFLPWMAPSSRLRIIARDWLLRLASLPGADRLFMNSLSPGGHRLIT